MPEKPEFHTAVPKRRLQIGEFTAVILGDIESHGDSRYTYILAMVRDGENTPSLYVTAEKSLRGGSGPVYRLRVLTPDFSEDIEVTEDIGALDRFGAQSLGIAASLLGLSEEQPHRLT